MVHGAIISKPYLRWGHNLFSNFIFATLNIKIVTGACVFLMHELLPLNLNFQVKNEQSNMFWLHLKDF